jgi:hypothetical protein
MRACYVALNMHGLLPAIDAGFNFSSRDIEAFGGDKISGGLVVSASCAARNVPDKLDGFGALGFKGNVFLSKIKKCFV